MSTANNFLLQKVRSPSVYFCASTVTIPVGDRGTRHDDLWPPLSLAFLEFLSPALVVVFENAGPHPMAQLLGVSQEPVSPSSAAGP